MENHKQRGYSMVGLIMVLEIAGTVFPPAFAEENIAGISPAPAPEQRQAAQKSTAQKYPRYLVAVYPDPTGIMTAEINDEGKLIIAQVGRRLPCGLFVKNIELSRVDLSKTNKSKVVESVYMPVY